MTRHTVTFVPEPGGFLVSCSQSCNLGTSAHAADQAQATSRARLHELATGYESGTPVADALAKVDRTKNDGTSSASQAWEALRELAEAVRASLAAFSESDVRTLAETANDLGGGAMYLPPEQRRVLDKALALFGLVPGLNGQQRYAPPF